MNRNAVGLFTPQNLAWLGMCLMLGGMNWARALVSIGTGVLAAAAVWQVGKTLFDPSVSLYRNYSGRLQFAVSLSLLVFLPLFSYGWTSAENAWLEDIRIKLSFLAIPFSLAVIPRISRRNLLALKTLFVCSQLIIALGTVLQFGLDPSPYLAMIQRNANIPIWGGESHIYFSLSLTIVVLISLDSALRNPTGQPRALRTLFAIGGFLGFIILHVLSSRTGYLALYGGLLVYGFAVWPWHKKQWRKYSAFALVTLLLLPVGAYFTLSSFRERIDVTVWDFQRFNEPSVDLSHHTVSMRFITWEIAWDIWGDAPLLGVGPGDMAGELARGYAADPRTARMDPQLWLKSTHNQFLEHLAGQGLVGLVALLGVFYLGIMRKRPVSALRLGLMGLFAAAMLGESILERQYGIVLFCVWLMLVLEDEQLRTDPSSLSG